MGLLDIIFKKKHQEEWEKQLELENWTDIVYTRKDIDIDDPVQRREYVENCLQQMAEASRDLDSLQFEYRAVTSHLRDMEEIDALPSAQRYEVNKCAELILDSEAQQKNFNKRKSRMSDADFERMERLQGDVKKGVESLREAEEYQKKVKNDLRRLDGERQAYEFRRNELEVSIENMHKMMIVIAVALGVITLVLLVLSIAFDLTVIYGYMVAILVAALSFLYLNQKIHESRKEKKVVLNTIAKKLDKNQKALIQTLRKYRIKDPDIWIHQAVALVNHNEEVEIRHSLVGQRQSLRKQMDYNRDIVAGNAKNEIEELVRQYPIYRQEILDMVSRYENEYPGA